MDGLLGIMRLREIFTPFTIQSRILTTLKKKPFENSVGKGENAGNQHFLLFPHCFLPFFNQIIIFSATFILSSANPFNFDQPKNLSFGKELSPPPPPFTRTRLKCKTEL